MDLGLKMTVLSFILFTGVALNKFSKFLKMPILLCFLGVGILCGPYGIQILPKFDMDIVQQTGEIAICFIIFTGGLQTSFKSIKSVFVTGTILATVGVVLTAVLSAAFIVLITQMSLFRSSSYIHALLAAAVFSSTDAAAVFAILRGQKAAINPKLQSLLEYESGSNDPAAFLLTSVLIGVFTAQQSVDFTSVSFIITRGIIWGLGIGTVIGLAVAVFGQWFYNWIQTFLEYNGMRLVLAVAIVLFCYGLATYCPYANPLMACYVAGIAMGNMRFNFKHVFIKFHDGISWLMQIILFTILGSFFNYHMLFNLKIMCAAVFTSFFLMLIVRPLVVMLCMIKSPFTMRERIFTGWVGIRGSAPIMLAAMVMPCINDTKIAYNFFYIVFTIVLLSILIQGSTLMWFAKKLGLVRPYTEKEDAFLEYNERPDGRELAQFTVTARNPLADKKLNESEWNAELILLMIKRGKKYIQPHPDTVIKKGDLLTFLGEQSVLKRMQMEIFPDEAYSPSLTFRQIMIDWSKKIKKLRQKKTKEISKKP